MTRSVEPPVDSPHLTAREHLRRDRPDLALPAARRAVELAPADGAAAGLLSEVCTRLGRHDEAILEALRARRLEPHDPYRHDRFARALLAADAGPAEADRAARTAVEIDPRTADFRITAAAAAARLGDRSRARRALLDALALEPDHPIARRDLALLGDLPDARRGTPRRPRGSVPLVLGAGLGAVLLPVAVTAPAGWREWLLAAGAVGAGALRLSVRR